MAKKKAKLVSLIVPCFNEEEALPVFYEETTKVLKTIKEEYELILVDDGSKDKTLDIMQLMSKKDKHVKYISFSRNFGKESAMYAGLCNSKGDYVGFIDADLQHPPILILEMIEALNNDMYDCAACRRINRTGDSKIRTWFARKFYKIVNSISDANMMDGAGDFRLMKRKMVDTIVDMKEYSRFSKGIFSWVGFNTYWIEYENVDRIAGTTSWKFWGLVKYAIDGIINFSSFPLQLPFIFAIIIFCIAFILLLIIIFSSQISLLLPISCLLLVIGGLQFICLSIMGQYIGKIYSQVKQRPHYIIREKSK